MNALYNMPSQLPGGLPLEEGTPNPVYATMPAAGGDADHDTAPEGDAAAYDDLPMAMPPRESDATAYEDMPPISHPHLSSGYSGYDVMPQMPEAASYDDVEPG